MSLSIGRKGMKKISNVNKKKILVLSEIKKD